MSARLKVLDKLSIDEKDGSEPIYDDDLKKELLKYGYKFTRKGTLDQRALNSKKQMEDINKKNKKGTIEKEIIVKDDDEQESEGEENEIGKSFEDRINETMAKQGTIIITDSDDEEFQKELEELYKEIENLKIERAHRKKLKGTKKISKNINIDRTQEEQKKKIQIKKKQIVPEHESEEEEEEEEEIIIEPKKKLKPKPKQIITKKKEIILEPESEEEEEEIEEQEPKKKPKNLEKKPKPKVETKKSIQSNNKKPSALRIFE